MGTSDAKTPAQRKLEILSVSGELGPTETITLISDVIGAMEETDYETPQLVYEAFCSLVWSLLVSQNYEPEMYEWYDVLRQAASLVMAKGWKAANHKILTLAELVLTSARFGEAHGRGNPAPDHWTSILTTVVDQFPRGVSLDDLKEKTGIMPNLLPRIISAMKALGILRQKGYGRNSVIMLPQ